MVNYLRDLLESLLNFAVQNQFNGAETGVVTWNRTKETCRRSFCLTFDGDDGVAKIRTAIYYHKPTIYGGMAPLTENELVFDGVPETYVLDEVDDGMDIWMIPYLVVFGLVGLGITASLYSSLRADKSVEPEEHE